MSVVLFAQIPGIPYQAVLLSQENAQELPGYDSEYANLLTNSIVSVRFSIYDVDGVEFKEVHSDVIVDAYGQEYISLLARQGKIDAYKEGKNWLTSKKAIHNYIITRKRNR